MPTYDYECENCGPFREFHPISEFDRKQPCPDCGDPAPRLLTLPAIGGAAAEAAPGAPAPASHPGGCACCAGPRSFRAEAV